ncbi:tRNA lysidine(34) synthetase TilS [Desulfonatronovibrio hydrogenovorans]|uniref:tRNA lysidine(34) synthetase TilS n=1 Tax=Desulfonatronovibrio hydrogenovorans TaxID=53245 RepID=UPI0005517BB6|nr:tRNA lysidine(34) synthetase TilS [Desulfonatronovibrio hydrogenovorans]
MYSKLQELPPKWARFCLNIQSCMEEMTGQPIKDSHLLIAFSAGPDSMALLRILDFVRQRARIRLSAFHVNHMLRDEARTEQDFAVQECSRLGIPIQWVEVDVRSFAKAEKIGTEEAGRKLRYEHLLKAASRDNADYILTGHQLNDLAEDMVMRLCRGTGWPGLAGMSGFDPKRKLLRPLILTPKQSILDFLDVIDQPYIKDPSNKEMSFLRNRVRHELIPLLENINPGFLKSASGLWKLGKIDTEYWDGQISQVKVVESGDGKWLPQESLLSLSQAARLRLYKDVLDRLGPGQVLLGNLLDLDRLWAKGDGNREVGFPGSKIARIVKKGILFEQNDIYPT